jgi:hypothetical protein
LCITHKKVFSHESTLYTTATIRRHNRTGDPEDPSFKGHPECTFCNKRFYGSDELYDHCRQNHEQCFLCQRQGIRDQYFLNYLKLEDHFNHEHFPCLEQKCLEQKFVVFESDLDLQGHILKEHADAKTKAKGQKILIDFNYASSGNPRRRGKSALTDDNDLNSSFQNLSSFRRVPAGFGAQLTEEHPPISSIPTKAQVGRSSSPSMNFPLPAETVPNTSMEVLLTPAQNDVLVQAGPEIVLSIQKLIGMNVNTFSSLKIAIWFLRQGTLSAEKVLDNFYQMCLDFNQKKNPERLLTEMALVWHKIIDTLPQEATSDQINRALEKRSKKKGLTIEEFEALRKGEPRKTAMLRVWNNHKVRVRICILS